MAAAGLAAEVEALPWYHTIDLPGGVVTPGHFDTRATLDKVPLPGSLAGRRCLDVGTWDGFWAFDMERRGAAEVVAIDIEDPSRWDLPPRMRLESPGEAERLMNIAKQFGRPFAVAREALGSAVERRDMSVYDLDPDEVGQFDLVFMGSLLLHLRDPVRALDRVRSVCRGEVVLADAVELIPTLLHPRTPVARLDGMNRPWWWQPNVAAFRRMVVAAGFEVLEHRLLYFLPLGSSHPRMNAREALRSLRTAAGREELVVQVRGVPHSAIRGRPLQRAG